MQDRGATLLLITASVPFSKEDENKGRNNHWVAGLIDLRDRTLYVMDSKRVAEVSRARILLNRVQRFWQRLGDDERSQGPVRAQIIRNVEQVRGDEHSCGPRVLDWIIRLMYFPRSILQGEDWPGLAHPERLWITWYASFIGLQTTAIHLRHFTPYLDQDKEKLQLCAASPEPVIDMGLQLWRDRFKKITGVIWTEPAYYQAALVEKSATRPCVAARNTTAASQDRSTADDAEQASSAYVSGLVGKFMQRGRQPEAATILPPNASSGGRNRSTADDADKASFAYTSSLVRGFMLRKRQ